MDVQNHVIPFNQSYQGQTRHLFPWKHDNFPNLNNPKSCASYCANYHGNLATEPNVTNKKSKMNTKQL